MKNRIFNIISVIYFGIFILLLSGLKQYFFYEQAPDQPINFSHQKHVSELGLKCDFCHKYAEKSIHATVPAADVCMSCHKAVAKDKPEIQKLTQYWSDKNPIPWTQIHKVKDHVYFTHKRHIRAGLDCVNCHGEVQKMEKIRRVSSLRMGWCVDCHKSRGAPLDCYTCHK